jgi:hypothetical protein
MMISITPNAIINKKEKAGFCIVSIFYFPYLKPARIIEIDKETKNKVADR